MGDAAGALIHLEGVSKVFQNEEFDTYALSDMDLEIHAGEFVSVSGPSGCGKTTLLSILGLLDSPSAGAYSLDQRRVESLSPADRARVRREQIGFIFQNFNLIGDLSVHENVDLPLTYRGVSRSDRSAGPAAGGCAVGVGSGDRPLARTRAGAGALNDPLRDGGVQPSRLRGLRPGPDLCGPRCNSSSRRPCCARRPHGRAPGGMR